MNLKLLLKSLLVVVILLLMVLIGLHNRSTVSFTLPPIIPVTIKQPAALMYIGFFALGFLTATGLMAGGGKKGAGGSNRPPKAPK